MNILEGDSVRVIFPDLDGAGNPLMGKIGRVITDDGDGTFLIQIKGIDGHNGRGELTDGDGWYFAPWGLEKI